MVRESTLRKVMLLDDACVSEILTAMNFVQRYKISCVNKGMTLKELI